MKTFVKAIISRHQIRHQEVIFAAMEEWTVTSIPPDVVVIQTPRAKSPIFSIRNVPLLLWRNGNWQDSWMKQTDCCAIIRDVAGRLALFATSKASSGTHLRPHLSVKARMYLLTYKILCVLFLSLTLVQQQLPAGHSLWWPEIVWPC